MFSFYLVRERTGLSRFLPLIILISFFLGACSPAQAPVGEIELPDLAVTSISIYMQTQAGKPCVDAYGPYEIRVSVANLGRADAYNIVVEGTHGAQELIEALVVGERYELKWPADSQTGEYTVQVDPQNLIAESDEDNNGASYRAPTPTPPILCPTPVPATPIPEPTASPSPTPTLAPVITPTAIAAQGGQPVCLVEGAFPLAFLPDSQRIVLWNENGFRIFDLETQAEVDFIAAPAKLMSPVSMSPNGDFLAWALDDYSIQLYQISSQTTLTLTGHTSLVTELIFSPDSTHLFSASHDTWVYKWDIHGNLSGSFQPTGDDNFPGEVLGLDVSPDGKQLITLPSFGPFKIWDADSFALVRELTGTGGFDHSRVIFSPDGRYAAGDLATGLFLWDLTDGRQLLGGNPGINAMVIAFSPDGRYFAYGEITEGMPVVLTKPDGSEIIKVLAGHERGWWSMIFSPDSSMLVTGDGVDILVWHVDGGKLLYTSKNACP